MALPQLIPGAAQFPYNFAAAAAAAAPNLAQFYYPQPMSAAAQAAAAAAQTNYLQGLQGYTAFNGFGSYPQASYIR